MERRVAIKARIGGDLKELERLIFNYTDSLGTVFKEKDVYFNCKEGTLKLYYRREDCVSILKYYRMAKDDKDHSSSECWTTSVDDFNSLRATLSASLGEICCNSRIRRYFVKGSAFIMLDTVEKIGQFASIVIHLTQKYSIEEGLKEAKHIQNFLNIKDEQIVPLDYVETLLHSSFKKK